MWYQTIPPPDGDHHDNSRQWETVHIQGSSVQVNISTFQSPIDLNTQSCCRAHYEFWLVAHTQVGEGGRSKVVATSPTDDGTFYWYVIKFTSLEVKNASCSFRSLLTPPKPPTPQLNYIQRDHIPAPARITSFSASLHHPASQALSLPCNTVGNPPPRWRPYSI